MTTNNQSLKDSGESANENVDNNKSSDGSVQTCHELTWIDIEVVGDDDQPIPNVRYKVFKPDGTLLGQGRVDENGCGGFERIEEGTYTVTFPDLDEESWEKA
ncbi:MAG: hypothetical protein AAF799_19295 [Myxococcota bacterium]